MRTLRTPVVLVALGIIAGCAPRPLRVEATGADSARLSVKLIEGSEPTIPTECSLPCEIKIPRSTTHQLHIEAPGYYAAEIEVTSSDVSAQGENNVFRVPLRRSPSGL
jgi:hypothetical protein